jgi:hypothetical protein
MNVKEYNRWSAHFRETQQQLDQLVSQQLDKTDALINSKPRGELAPHLRANDIDLKEIAQKIWDMALVYEQMMQSIDLSHVVFEEDQAP